MDVSAETWRTLSTLLDEALDRAPAERGSWLARIGTTRPDLLPLLEKLLAAHGTVETEDLLARPPALTAAFDAPAGAPESDDPSDLRPGRQVGPYRLARALGSGGMADVWLAQRDDGRFTRNVALKLPRFALLRRDLAQRFDRERDILARLEHPHIARLYDAGVAADGLPWLAMEYVDGEPITAHCDKARLGIAARLRLFAQVLGAVQYAHASLVIHRDLKPSNILVTADGQARLLDFGIAKLLAGDSAAHETHLTQLGGRALTPDYASPEQVLGQPLTTATDVYSLGVVLYELLSGRRPYRLKVPSVAQLEQAIVGIDPARPSAGIDEKTADARDLTARTLARQLDGDLDTIVMKALAKSPAARYATVVEFAEDLERFRNGLPVRARPASLAYRTRKFVARHRVAAGAASGVALALAVGAGIALWQAREAQREAAKAAAVKEFLTELFRANSLESADAARRRSLSAGQLLEEGALRIGTAFQDQPALKAELQGVVGGLLHDLSLNDRALALRRERVALLREADAPAADQATALRDVADTLAQNGDVAAAQREVQAAIDLLIAAGKGETPLRWSLVSTLGYLGVGADRVDAEAKLQQAADQLARFAPRSTAFAEALLNLGEAHSAANRPERALALFNEALPLLEQSLGPRSMRLAMHRYHVAHALASQRWTREAATQMRAALATLAQTAGKDHPATANVQVQLARMLSIQGEPAQARALLVEAVAVLGQRKDIDPAGYTEALLYLGESFLDEGNVAPAGAPLDEAMRRIEAADAAAQGGAQAAGANAGESTVARLIYARYLLDTGRYADALAQLAQARAARFTRLGPGHPWVASLDNRVGLVHQAAGRTGEAEAAFNAVMQSQANREDAFGSPRHLAQLNLAQVDIERQRFQAALPVVRRALAGFDVLPANERGRQAEISLRLRLARALVGTGDVDAAERELPRLAELTAPLYEHAPLRIAEHLVRARVRAARSDIAGARREIGLARASLQAQPALGPHFARQVTSAERETGLAAASDRPPGRE